MQLLRSSRSGYGVEFNARSMNHSQHHFTMFFPGLNSPLFSPPNHGHPTPSLSDWEKVGGLLLLVFLELVCTTQRWVCNLSVPPSPLWFPLTVFLLWKRSCKTRLCSMVCDSANAVLRESELSWDRPKLQVQLFPFAVDLVCFIFWKLM